MNGSRVGLLIVLRAVRGESLGLRVSGDGRQKTRAGGSTPKATGHVQFLVVERLGAAGCWAAWRAALTSGGYLEPAGILSRPAPAADSPT
jgi:hypothetical protein